MYWPETCALLLYHLKYRTMDKHRKAQSSEERDGLASGRRDIDQPAGSGEYENTSGLEEKSIEDNGFREPDLEEQQDKIERIKEDSDLDRVK